MKIFNFEKFLKLRPAAKTLFIHRRGILGGKKVWLDPPPGVGWVWLERFSGPTIPPSKNSGATRVSLAKEFGRWANAAHMQKMSDRI